MGVVSVDKLYAADSTFSLFPSKGTVTAGKNFTIDVMIDSSGNNVTQARMVILYDPKYLKVIEAEYNASLFCTYPTDQQSVDNTNGVAMLSGFCQSGVSTLYKTSGGADVFARVIFQAKKKGSTKIEWNYNGKNQDYMSIIMKDGSPATNSLTAKPAGGVYTITASGSTGVDPDEPEFPSTGIATSWGVVSVGAILIAVGWLYMKLGKKSQSKMRTVVLYE